MSSGTPGILRITTSISCCTAAAIALTCVGGARLLRVGRGIGRRRRWLQGPQGPQGPQARGQQCSLATGRGGSKASRHLKPRCRGCRISRRAQLAEADLAQRGIARRLPDRGFRCSGRDRGRLQHVGGGVEHLLPRSAKPRQGRHPARRKPVLEPQALGGLPNRRAGPWPAGRLTALEV